jgi:hypothetical protein
MEIFMIGAWFLWKERNNLIFNNAPPSPATWKSSFKMMVAEHLIRIKQELHQSIKEWMDSV